MPSPAQHPSHRYHSCVFLAPCFRNDIYDTSTGSLHSGRTWVSSWICSVSIGYGSLWEWSVRKPRRLRLNLGLGRDDEPCGGGRGCVRELVIYIVDSTPGVQSMRSVRSAFGRYLEKSTGSARPTSPTSFASHISWITLLEECSLHDMTGTMFPESPFQFTIVVWSRLLGLTACISKPNLWPAAQAQETWNSLEQSQQRTTAPPLSEQRLQG